MIQIFASDHPDQSLDERVRHRGVGRRLDLFDVEDPQVHKPSVITKRGIVIRADPNPWRVAADGQSEHAARGWAVDIFAADVKSDDTTGEYVDDHQDPMIVKEDRFAPEPVHLQRLSLA